MLDMAQAREIAGERRNGRKAPDEVTSVGIRVGARDRLEEYCASRHGMTMKDVLTSLVNWFCDQPESGQKAVLGELPKVKGYGFEVAPDGTVTIKPTPRPDE